MQTTEIFSVLHEWLTTNLVSLLTAIAVIGAGWILSRLVSRTIRKYLPNSRGVDKTIAPILAQFARYAIFIVAIVIALSQLGVQTASMLAVLGAAGLAIALALQGTLSNIAAGVMLIWLRPMSIGEYIDGNDVSGTVTEIGLFGTRLRTAKGIYVFVPNSQIWNAAITNYSREPRRRADFRVGIAYDADIAKARRALMKVATGDKRVLPDPAPVVHVDSLGDSAVVMLLRLWVSTPDYWDVNFAFNEQIKLALDKAGIEIPYNKLDVNLSGNINTKTSVEPK